MADADDTGVSTTEEGATPAAGVPSPATASNGPQGAPGAPAADWRATLPGGLRAEKSLATFKDVGALAAAFVETKRMAGSAVVIPGKDAPPEAVAAFREKLGVPKAPSDYPAPVVPEGETLDADRWARWTGYAHQLGLTAEQLAGLATLEAEERAGMLASAKQEWLAGLETLKQEWGAPLYAKNVTLAARAIDRHMSPEGKAFLDQSGLGNHPELVKAWASIGALLAEDGYIDGQVAGVPSTDEAKAQIAEIRAQGRAHPANNPDHPQYPAAQERLAQLYKTAFPGSGSST